MRRLSQTAIALPSSTAHPPETICFIAFSNFRFPLEAATFDLVNTPNISTIFSRVTGGSFSRIDGLIQTSNGNQPVSLFLLNPNGIVFR
uniref:Filamentous hemagglutinin N-terminal domain-containing protein n=1 Tax=Desertifilum tharense IPPAS B-1220 TaxID=1781255 RepID=A0ACD5H1R8_9CYAN